MAWGKDLYMDVCVCMYGMHGIIGSFRQMCSWVTVNQEEISSKPFREIQEREKNGGSAGRRQRKAVIVMRI